MENKESNNNKVTRRDILKGLATVPVLGAFGYGMYKKWNLDRLRHNSIAQELGLSFSDDDEAQSPVVSDGKTIRLGIIG
ncbi:MAG TPA: hypothetical protein PLF35_14895, partial [Prolixibacteraceae bacterium]|nr:hypothetical protein [Prolixibacteraceae bacterium]